MNKNIIANSSWWILTALLLALSFPLFAQPQMARTTAPVFWTWNVVEPIGTSSLVRNESGITAVFHTTALPRGQAVTLWFIFFNNPENCSTNPCSIDDLFDPDVAGDFHFASGHVTGGSEQATFAAHLNVGDTSGSGRAEIGFDEGVALMDPFDAEVLLAVHSHGPAFTGPDLRQQISSFLGGCQTFLGPGGFAAGPDDIPALEGECSTVQVSLHQSQP